MNGREREKREERENEENKVRRRSRRRKKMASFSYKIGKNNGGESSTSSMF